MCLREPKGERVGRPVLRQWGDAVKKIIFSVLLFALPASSQEARCNALGSVCICAETLDDRSGAHVFDGYDATPEATKDCTGAYPGGVVGLPGTNSTNNIKFELPSVPVPGAGNSTNWALTAVDGVASGVSGEAVTQNVSAFSQGTWCFRAYQRFDSALVTGFIDINNPYQDRLKITDLAIGNSGANNYSLFQEQWGPSGAANAGWYIEFEDHGQGGLPTVYSTTSGTPVKLGDCSSHWCRFDECITMNGGQMKPRAMITRLSDGASDVKIMSTLAKSSVTLDPIHQWMANLYIQHGLGGGTATGGHRHAAYVMSAFWPTPQADTVWIGAASEVEGGGAPDTTPPTVPTGLSAVAAGSTQINVSWTASTDSDSAVAGYQIERCSGVSCSSFAQIADQAGITFSDTGLAPSTSYSYRVNAYDPSANFSAYSSVASATTTGNADTTPPTAPAAMTCNLASPTQIDCSWTAATDNVGVTAYLPEICLGTGCSNFSQWQNTPNLSASYTGAQANTVHRLRVRATDAAGNLGPYSPIVTVAAPPSSSPRAAVLVP